MGPAEDDVTRLLLRIQDGDAAARDDLFRVLYDRLRDAAGRLMRGQSSNHTLQATALVGEVYLRIAANGGMSTWNDRSHFLAAAARGMRHVLIDHARKKRVRGDIEAAPVPLDRVVVAYEDATIDLVRLDEVLTGLAKVDPEMARAVEIRFFAGSSLEDLARMLGVADRTFQRRWNAIRSWIYDQLAGE